MLGVLILRLGDQYEDRIGGAIHTYAGYSLAFGPDLRIRVAPNTALQFSLELAGGSGHNPSVIRSATSNPNMGYVQLGFWFGLVQSL
jgi:hypothetical protein